MPENRLGNFAEQNVNLNDLMFLALDHAINSVKVSNPRGNENLPDLL